MKNTWLKFLVAISAIMIAGSAAYFSVTGLGVLFSGAAVAVMVMAGSLEFAKLVTATYLKQEWDNIKGINKWYLTSAVVILMAITSAGIFGYLSNAFQQQNIKLDQVQREIDVWNNKITYTNQQIVTLQGQQKDLTTTQNSLITKGNVNNRLLRSVDNRDRQANTINKKINSLQDSIVAYNGQINNIKNANIGIEREVGGFRFVAEAFGVELKSVVKFFIILIVVVFDPLAVALVISFNQLMLGRRKEDEEIKPTTDPEDLKNFVDETVRLRLTEDDLKKLEEILMNPPAPNEALVNATEEYKEKVEDKPWNGVSQEVWDRMAEIEKQREAIHGPILDEDVPTGALANSGIREKREREELLAEIMQMDQELGLYDEPFDNPIIDEEISTIEPTEEEEQQNFSTIEPNSENIFQNNFTESETNEEISENVKQDEVKSYQSQIDTINQMLSEFENVTFSQEPTTLNPEEVITAQLNELISDVDNLEPRTEVVPALGDDEVREMFMDEWERKFDLVEDEEFEEAIKEELDSVAPFGERFDIELVDGGNYETEIPEVVEDDTIVYADDTYSQHESVEEFATPEQVERFNIDIKIIDNSPEFDFVVNQVTPTPEFDVEVKVVEPENQDDEKKNF